MDVSTLATVVGVVFSLFVLGAASVAVVRASYVKAQLEGLRGDRDDLQTRVKLLEDDNVRVSEALKVEKDKVAVLERVVTGKEQLDSIQNTLETYIKNDTEWKVDQRKTALNILGLIGSQRDGEKV